MLLVNLDFQDFVYSELWRRAVLRGCAQRNFVVDSVAVNPFVGRDLAGELGVPRASLEIAADGTTVWLDKPDESRARSAIGQLVERNRYQTVVVNCDAPLFVHLLVDRARELSEAVWFVYDRHLHLGLSAYEQDPILRERMAAADLHLFAIEEIATPGDVGVGGRAVRNDATFLGSFGRLGLREERIHFQQWPMDDVFFAPQPGAASADPFVVFSGGDSGRDYSTLFDAVRDLPVQLRLCAHNHPTPIPSNVTILPRLPLHRFRDEMARATIVVVPLTGSPPVSGITVIAMAKMLGRPVIASDNRVVRIQIRSQGDGGYLAQVGNPVLMRALLNTLIESPAERERLSREGRAQAARDLSLTAFIDRMFV